MTTERKCKECGEFKWLCLCDSSRGILRTRLFEALVERAARAVLTMPFYHRGWNKGVFDTCQKVTVRDLGFTDAEFLAAVKARQESA